MYFQIFIDVNTNQSVAGDFTFCVMHMMAEVFVYITILVAEHVNPASQVSSVVICYKVNGEMDLTSL